MGYYEYDKVPYRPSRSWPNLQSGGGRGRKRGTEARVIKSRRTNEPTEEVPSARTTKYILYARVPHLFTGRLAVSLPEYTNILKGIQVAPCSCDKRIPTVAINTRSH